MILPTSGFREPHGRGDRPKREHLPFVLQYSQSGNLQYTEHTLPFKKHQP